MAKIVTLYTFRDFNKDVDILSISHHEALLQVLEYAEEKKFFINGEIALKMIDDPENEYKKYRVVYIETSIYKTYKFHTSDDSQGEPYKYNANVTISLEKL